MNNLEEKDICYCQSGWKCPNCVEAERNNPKLVDMIKADLSSLENRLMCYHYGTHGRSTVKMHVELKKIKEIKKQLDQLQ